MAQNEEHTTNPFVDQSSSESEESESESTSSNLGSQIATDHESQVDTACSAETNSRDKDAYSEKGEKEYSTLILIRSSSCNLS